MAYYRLVSQVKYQLYLSRKKYVSTMNNMHAQYPRLLYMRVMSPFRDEFVINHMSRQLPVLKFIIGRGTICSSYLLIERGL